MVTILREADWEPWLRGSYDDMIALQQLYPAEHMTVRGPVFETKGK